MIAFSNMMDCHSHSFFNKVGGLVGGLIRSRFSCFCRLIPILRLNFLNIVHCLFGGDESILILLFLFGVEIVLFRPQFERYEFAWDDFTFIVFLDKA